MITYKTNKLYLSVVCRKTFIFAFGCTVSAWSHVSGLRSNVSIPAGFSLFGFTAQVDNFWGTFCCKSGNTNTQTEIYSKRTIVKFRGLFSHLRAIYKQSIN